MRRFVAYYELLYLQEFESKVLLNNLWHTYVTLMWEYNVTY